MFYYNDVTLVPSSIFDTICSIINSLTEIQCFKVSINNKRNIILNKILTRNKSKYHIANANNTDALCSNSDRIGQVIHY